MNKKTFVKGVLRQYAKETHKAMRSMDDLSPMEEWLLDKLFKSMNNLDFDVERDHAFSGLVTMYNNTAGATFQYYFNKSKGEHVITFPSLRTSIAHISFDKCIEEAEDFVLRERKAAVGQPKFTLLYDND